MGKTKQNGVLKRLRKNIMCGVLSCVLVFGAVLLMPKMGMTARAAETFEVDGIKYTVLYSPICRVTGYDPNKNIGPELSIPASVENKDNGNTYNVVTIGSNAFNGCITINKVILKEGITSIESNAFSNSSIEEIEIPESISGLSSNIFSNCGNLKKIQFKRTIIPNGVIEQNWLGNHNKVKIELPEDADIDSWKSKLHLYYYPNMRFKGDNEDSTSGSSSTTSSSPSHENNSDGEVEFIEEEPINRIPAHVCQYEWEVVREVGANQDGLEQYLCKLCGNVQSTLTIPASQYQVQELYTKVIGAGEGETITYDTGLIHTVCDKLYTKLQERKDVTLVITYQYKGENYRTTFPAGVDYTELMQDADQFYGMLGLNGRCGIVTEKN